MPFFYRYINFAKILQQFVQQYDNGLAHKVEKENNIDFVSSKTIFPCNSFKMHTPMRDSQKSKLNLELSSIALFTMFLSKEMHTPIK